jgi:hypothetical protein
VEPRAVLARLSDVSDGARLDAHQEACPLTARPASDGARPGRAPRAPALTARRASHASGSDTHHEARVQCWARVRNGLERGGTAGDAAGYRIQVVPCGYEVRARFRWELRTAGSGVETRRLQRK